MNAPAYGPHAQDATAFGGGPLVYYSPSQRTWRLAQDFMGKVGESWVYIPAPFDFDLASIPRVLWPALACHELGIRAPLCHDWLYRSGGNPEWGSISPRRTYTRAETDRLFLELMKADGVSWWRRTAAYLAVRAFGGKAWRG
jgi:hypothetical protein